MGNGTKVALVALLILMVVVIARFVRNTTEDPNLVSANPQTKAGSTAPAKPSDPSKTKAITPPSSNPGGTAAPGVTAATPRERSPVVSLQPPRPAQGGNPAGVPPGVASSDPLKPTPIAPGAAAGVGNPAGSSGSSSPTAPPPGVAHQAPVIVPGEPGAGTSPSNGGTALAPKPVPPTVASRDVASRESSQSSGPSQGSSVLPPVRQPAPLNGPGGASGARPLVGTELRPSGQQQPGSPEALKNGGTTQLPRPLPTPPTVVQGAPTYPLTHTIEKGDSFWSLSQKFYKDATLWQTIEKANVGVKLIPGKTLSIPEPPAPKALAISKPSVAVDSDPASTPRGGAGSRMPRASAPTNGPQASEKPEKDLTPIERIARDGRARLSGSTAGPTADGKATATQSGLLAAGPSKATDYVVKRGDTLSGIAKHFYKDSRKYYLIEDANDGLKYESLQEGAKIKIPMLESK